MRYLVVYAHPVETSYASMLHRSVVQTLTEAGHEVDDCDLYAENFQPVLTRDERIAYHDLNADHSAVARHIERLRRCEGLVLSFPTWWFGMPAMLKGYIDRIWLPGVAFALVDGQTQGLLQNVVRFAVVTTYGSPWWLNKLMGDTNRLVLMRGVRRLLSPRAHTLWLAQYGMDVIDDKARERFRLKVERRLRTF
jgi:putative NADPH-quinone reductase